MEARSIHVTKYYIRILNRQGLHALQQILGAGIRIGLTRSRPTKNTLMFVALKEVLLPLLSLRIISLW
jgi:hypothetical protein